MGDERRQHRRVPGPFDGTCDGAAGRREVRIVDLSIGGCFVDMMSPTRMGELVHVEVRAAGRTARLFGQVVYVDRVQGFAVMFTENDPEQIQQLVEILRAKA
jgi:PilZ domain